MINAKKKCTQRPKGIESNSEAMAVTATALTVHVFLPSGRCASVFASSTWTVGDLRLAAQDALACGFIRLCSAAGCTLDSMLPLQSIGIQDGDHMNAIVQSAQIASARGALALFYNGGGLVGWGDQECADIAREDLWGVQHVQATSRAFAAVLSDGRVVTYGDADLGGDSSRVQSQLSDVLQIQAPNGAFAAILADGSVVSWGRRGFGGDSSAVQDKLKSVGQIQATAFTFAAILADGNVVTWGPPLSGGDSSMVQEKLVGVKQIQATSSAFAAVLADGCVVSWGSPHCGGNCSQVQHLRDISFET